MFKGVNSKPHLRSGLFWDVTQRELVVSDVLGQRSSPISKGEAVLLDCLAFEDGTNRLRRNVGNYKPTLRDIPEGRISRLQGGGRPKSPKP
jgi:hypothetical protein